jgi:hypothetical protein
MKAVFTLLALATSAIAQNLAPRWGNPEPTTTVTLTTFTTTTYCISLRLSKHRLLLPFPNRRRDIRCKMME